MTHLDAFADDSKVGENMNIQTTDFVGILVSGDTFWKRDLGKNKALGQGATFIP